MSAVVGLLAFAWTGIGESSNPELEAREMPVSIVSECAVLPSCDGTQGYSSRWVAKTPQGHLFLVSPGDCVAGTCQRWVVEKGSQGAVRLLTIEGGVQLVQRQDTPYPEVRMKVAASDVKATYNTYRWLEGRYIRTASEDIYQVDGVECGTAAECNLLAQKSVRSRDMGRALRIWETVHNVSWI